MSRYVNYYNLNMLIDVSNVFNLKFDNK